MGEETTTLVAVSSSTHHETLVEGLWRLFDTKRQTDFFFQWGALWIEAHRLVVDVFLSPETFGQYAGDQPPTYVEQEGSDELATLFRFLYRGTVDVKQEQLDACLQLAKALEFHTFVDALDACCFSMEQPTDASPITVICPGHHDTLVNGLWNSFTAGRGVNFFLKWAGLPMVAHHLVVEVFLDVDNLLGGASLEPSALDDSGSLDSVVEFMYRGTVDVPEGQLNRLLQTAEELGFDMLVDAVKAAMIAIGLPSYVPIARRLKRLVQPTFSIFKPLRACNETLKNGSDCPPGTSAEKHSSSSGSTKKRKVIPDKKKSSTLGSKRKSIVTSAVKMSTGSTKKKAFGKSNTDPERSPSPAADLECGCIVEQLLQQTFSKRDLETRIRIVKEGRPTPELPHLKKRVRGFIRRFRADNYKRIEWLAGCPKLNRVFCWPCLLFSNSFLAWDRVGYSDLNNLSNSAARHARSFNHLCCLQTLTAFATGVVEWPAAALMPGRSAPDGQAPSKDDASVGAPASPSSPTEPTFDGCGLEAVRASYSNSSTPTDPMVPDIPTCDCQSGCIIEQLLSEPFKEYDSERQVAVVNAGRPTPSLPTLTKDSGKGYVRKFQDHMYQKSDWLAGCQKVNRLFCWPCLLFAEESSVWAKQGYCDLNNLHNSIHRHEQSLKHLACSKTLSTFGDTTDPLRDPITKDGKKAFPTPKICK